MNLIDVGIKWRDHLRWYQRVALMAWWVGIGACILSMLLGAWLLLATDGDSVEQSSAAAAVLLGILVLFVTRSAVALAARRRRVRLRRIYY
jgi:hypothetical protein